MKKIVRRTVYGLSALLFLFILTNSQSYASPAEATYEVTFTNLTAGQPLTPPLVAVHRASVNVFTIGEAASFGLQQIAENGDLSFLMDDLNNNKHVSSVQVAFGGTIPPILPGESVTIDVSSSGGANFISFASMLICTNDGFTGLNGLRLPKHVGETTTVQTQAYDAGSEINTEDLADIVPPCQGIIGVMDDDGNPGTGASNPALAEGGVIHHHAGIQGGEDLLPGTHGWSGPITTVSITRTN